MLAACLGCLHGTPARQSSWDLSKNERHIIELARSQTVSGSSLELNEQPAARELPVGIGEREH